MKNNEPGSNLKNEINHIKNITNLVQIIKKSNYKLKPADLVSPSKFCNLHKSVSFNIKENAIIKLAPFSKLDNNKENEIIEEEKTYVNKKTVCRSISHIITTPKRFKSFKKTKTHIKTPYKSKKNNSCFQKIKIEIESRNQNTKCNNSFNKILNKVINDNDNCLMINNILLHCNSEIIGNPYLYKINYKEDFQVDKEKEEREDDDNKSI